MRIVLLQNQAAWKYYDHSRLQCFSVCESGEGKYFLEEKKKMLKKLKTIFTNYP